MNLGVKVCGAMSEMDLHKAELVGANAVGVIVRPDSTYEDRSLGSHSVNTGRAQHLAAELSEALDLVLLPRTADFNEIVEMTEAILPDRVQIGQTGDPTLTAALHDVFLTDAAYPDIAQVIHVGKRTKPTVVDPFVGEAKYIHLDSDGPNPGGNGVTPDWHECRAIADRAKEQDMMVILAGGLTVANVAEAIEIVQPDGVDVETHIRKRDVYNQKIMQEFVDAAVQHLN